MDEADGRFVRLFQRLIAGGDFLIEPLADRRVAGGATRRVDGERAAAGKSPEQLTGKCAQALHAVCTHLGTHEYLRLKRSRLAEAVVVIDAALHGTCGADRRAEPAVIAAVRIDGAILDGLLWAGSLAAVAAYISIVEQAPVQIDFAFGHISKHLSFRTIRICGIIV